MLDYGVNKAQSVSIALATYNGEAFLEEQIKSLLAQDFPIHEIIICDDASTDGTALILKKYQPNDLFKIYRNGKNLGYVKNFQKACELCSGDYIALCDQDDIWEPIKISRQVEAINNNDLLGVFSDATLVDEKGKAIGINLWETVLDKAMPKKLDFRSFYLSNCVTGCTFFFHKSLLANALPFLEETPHDWWLAYHAAYLGGLGYCTEPLVQYRQHSGNVIGASLPKKEIRILHGIKKKIKRYIFAEQLKLYRNRLRVHDKRLKAFLVFEQSHSNCASSELQTLNRWIGDKISGRDLKKYADFFYMTEKNAVFDFYQPSKKNIQKRIIENRTVRERFLKFRIFLGRVFILATVIGFAYSIFSMVK